MEGNLEALKTNLDKTDEKNEKALILDKINRTKNDLDEIYNRKIQGMLIRSKAKWVEHVEKPTRYFLKLETRHFLNKSIIALEKNDGTSIHNSEDILKETKAFYEKLYTEQKITPVDLEEYFKNTNVPKLNDEKMISLEG